MLFHSTNFSCGSFLCWWIQCEHIVGRIVCAPFHILKSYATDLLCKVLVYFFFVQREWHNGWRWTRNIEMRILRLSWQYFTVHLVAKMQNQINTHHRNGEKWRSSALEPIHIWDMEKSAYSAIIQKYGGNSFRWNILVAITTLLLRKVQCTYLHIVFQLNWCTNACWCNWMVQIAVVSRL